MTEFYGIQTGTIPGFAEAGGGKFMSVQGLPDRTVKNMVKFMDRLRGMQVQSAASRCPYGTSLPSSRTSAARRVMLTRGTTAARETQRRPWAQSASSVIAR